MLPRCALSATLIAQRTSVIRRRGSGLVFGEAADLGTHTALGHGNGLGALALRMAIDVRP